MGVWSVAPGRKEANFDDKLLRDQKFIPGAEVVEEGEDGQVVVPNVILLFVLTILCVNRGNDEF